MQFTTTSFGEQVVWKLRWFIVIKSWKSHCVAVAVHNYNEQGLTKLELENPRDHAALTLDDTTVELQQDEELARKPLHLILEDTSLKMDQSSRINFSKLYTVDYNIKVSAVGRIVNQDHHLLDEYVAQSIIKLDENSGTEKPWNEETKDCGHQIQQYSQSAQTKVATKIPTHDGVPNWRWWIPAEGISREVIQADIKLYIGPHAQVRPGAGIEQFEVSC